MYEEIYEHLLIQSWAKLKPHLRKSAGRKWQSEYIYRESVYGFRCRRCQAYVYTQPIISGVQNRNHCPYCLWSRHMDQTKPGDRMSACKAIMQPIGLTVKQRRNRYGRETYGELMVIHRCNDCGNLSINRIAADDRADRLLELFQGSFFLDLHIQDQLLASGIHLLQAEDAILVVNQLQGNRPV
jgi:hypothetical protein